MAGACRGVLGGTHDLNAAEGGVCAESHAPALHSYNVDGHDQNQACCAALLQNVACWAWTPYSTSARKEPEADA